MSIKKPMLAATIEDIKDVRFSVLCTAKLDGIRCLIVNKKALSRSFKEIPNLWIQETIESLPTGLDGELMVKGAEFNGVQSAVMSVDGKPDFQYCIFDYVKDSLTKPYNQRMNDLQDLDLPDFCIKVIPTEINSEAELAVFEAQVLSEGYEGVMLRSPLSPYKCGRATLREGYLSKLKRFKDSEAVITGFEERLRNENEATKDELGHTKRSSHQANMIPDNTLGKFLATDLTTGDKIKVGTGKGLTKELRQEIWNNKDKYIGKIFTYRYQDIGMKDLPRIPSFQGFRDPRDIS